MQSHPAIATSNVRVCVHCGAAGTTRFCGECGRALEAGPEAKPSLLREGVAEVLGMEHGIWGTVRDLLLRPGKVYDAYLRGNVDGYVRPLKLFFVLAGAYMLLLSLVRPLTFEMDHLLNQSNPEWGKAVADLVQRRGITQQLLNERFQARMNTATPLVIALAMLPMAWLLKAMRRERPFHEHLMFVLTFNNCVWLLSIALLPLMRVASQPAILALQMLGYGYMGVGFFAFYASSSRVRTWLKFGAYVVADVALTTLAGFLLGVGVLLSVLFF
jgi:hypothetical protein